MQYFFMKLYGLRPSFPADITPDEREVMTRHSAYWKDQIQRGIFGIGVIRLEDPAQVDQAFGE